MYVHDVGRVILTSPQPALGDPAEWLRDRRCRPGAYTTTTSGVAKRVGCGGVVAGGKG